MKARITFLSMLAMAGMAMTSCDDDDDDRWQPDVQVVNAFEERYPGASRAEWESKYDGNSGRYNVADFWYDGVECEAWFDDQGEWFMTEKDIRYEQLPQAVKTAHESGDYKDWQREDVDQLERRGMETIYVLDVEKKGFPDTDLYYAEDGSLIKAVEDRDDNNHSYTPSAPSNATDKVMELYPGATILDFEREDGGYEIDIRHDGRSKEVRLDGQGEWRYTTWEYRRVTDVPETAVQNAINNYETTNNCWVDDIDFYEYADGTKKYVVEFEGRNDRDYRAEFDTEGNTLR